VRLIQRLNHLLGLTSIIVSHDVQETAAIADYLYVIAQGQIIGEGSPDALLVSEDPRVHQFMHGEADGMVPFHFPARRFSEELLHEHE
ncbi:MAG: phospholipid ABC transporter ATP-binding protein MlaF, partial [Legionellaceae bacterium]|nr:phospholipid ABC transporter ATP-binding protein MlaF [Legionellaceae bacterium]